MVCLLTLTAVPAAAQPTTEEGIRAMLRGDYRGAVGILRPLADDPARPDPVADYFLAILYDTGHAGDNPPRACALFRRAASRDNPFAEQASALATQIEAEFGSGASLFCRPDETWQGGPPRIFDLAAGQRVVFTDTAIRVTHFDGEQSTAFLPPPAGRFLPIAYSVVPVTRPAPARRHLFQWFIWMPDTPARPTSWTLGWMLSEVAGDRWIPLNAEQHLGVFRGSEPPAAFDTSDLVIIGVNASGEAIVTIKAKSGIRTEVIPGPEDR